MKKKTNNGATNRNRSGSPDSPRRWRAYVLMFGCSLILVSGFFFAGRQHFSSMDYGMKNSKLRSQVAQLEAEKRRLLLTREMSLSPSELKKAARKIGIIDLDTNSAVAQVASAAKDKPVPPTADANTQPLIIKTASVVSARPTAEKADLTVDRPVKKITIAAE